MELDEIKAIVAAAIGNLLVHQPNLNAFTSATNQTEWNLAHHLANELHVLLNGYDCDIDVSKPNLDNRRPDIIIHERGSHENNLLVVEVKRDAGNIWNDVNKIMGAWFTPPLEYQFGAVVVIGDDDEPVFEVFENDDP